MKRIFCTLYVLALSLLLTAQTLTINVSNKPLKDVLPLVEQQCDYHFFYNTNLSGLDNPVTISLTQTPLEQALKKLFAGTGIAYKMAENKVIVLSPEEKKMLQELSAV